MYNLREVNEDNRELILKLIQKDIIKHVFAYYDLRYDPEHTIAYAAFKDGVPKGYVVIHTGRDFQTVTIESEHAEAAKLLIGCAPKDHFVIRTNLNLFKVIKKRYPSSKYYVMNMMLIKKGKARSFASSLARKLRVNDALQMAKIHAYPNFFDLIKEWHLFADHVKNRMPVKGGKTRFSATNFVGALKTKEDALNLRRLLWIVRSINNRPEKTLKKYIDWLAKMPIYGAFAEEELVSYAGSYIQTPQTWVIGGIYTHPKHRNKGYATITTSAITEEALRKAQTAILFVNRNNYSAIRMAEKIGYRKIGVKIFVNIGTELVF